MKRIKHWRLLLISILFTSTVTLANGGTRGGGNGLVCFDSIELAQSLHNQNQLGVKIPDSALQHIIKIEMLDFHTAQNDLKKHLILPKSSIKNLASKNLADMQILETEFDRYASRYEHSIPLIYQKLMEAKSVLSLPKLRLSNEAIEQTNDYVAFDIPNNCVVSTLFGQWPENESGSVASWEVDARLFFHPAHSFQSQVAALLHERFYWIGREKMYVSSYSGATLFIVMSTLNDSITYKEARRYYNDLFETSGGDWILPIFEPMVWFQNLWTRLTNTYVSQGGSVSPVNWQEVKFIYLKSFQSEVFSYPYLSKETLKDADRNLLLYFKGKVDPKTIVSGWPADFAASLLPGPQ